MGRSKSLIIAASLLMGLPAGRLVLAAGPGCREDARLQLVEPLDVTQRQGVVDAHSAAEQVNANSVWAALDRLVASLDVSPRTQQALRKAIDTMKAQDRSGFRPSAFSITSSAETTLGVGYQSGVDLVFFPDPQRPEEWQVAVFRYGGGAVGVSATLTAGIGFNVIYHMSNMEEYAGYFCGASMSAAKLMGLTVGAQVACERGDLKGIRERARSLASLKPAEFSSAAGDFFANRMFAVSVSATMGVGGGASLAMTDFTELSRHTLRTDQLGAFARSWIKDQRGL